MNTFNIRNLIDNYQKYNKEKENLIYEFVETNNNLIEENNQLKRLLGESNKEVNRLKNTLLMVLMRFSFKIVLISNLKFNF